MAELRRDAALAEDQFRHRNKRELGALAKEGAASSEEQIFYQLLREGGASANATAFHIAFSCDLHRVPIESMMLVEASVFRGDDGMLEIRRDLGQRNEFVTFVIRRVANPCLKAALHVHCGGRRVDPPRSQKNQRSKRPKKRYSDEKPSSDGSEITFPMRRLGGCVWIFSHTSE